MSKEKIVEQINELIKSGEKFLDWDLNNLEQAQSEKYSSWMNRCKTVLEACFGRDKVKIFRKASGVANKISVLKTLSSLILTDSANIPSPQHDISINISQIQSTHIMQELSFQILLNIEHSGLKESEQKEAVQLFEEVKNEVQKTNTNWDKVIELLKKSFDYGLKIAPYIVRFAEAYYKAKGIV